MSRLSRQRNSLASGLLYSTVALVFGMCGASCSQELDPPNVLFIAVDDLNTDLGTYGHDLVSSPHIDRLAARGVRFDRAYCQYPVCSPSRSSFLTGLYPEQTGVLSNQDSLRKHVPDIPTLPQWFREHGYHTARVGKLFHYGVPSQIGSDGMDDPASWSETVNPRGIDREIHDRIHTLVPNQFGGTLSWLSVDPEEGLHTDELGAAAAIRIMEEQHPSQDWYCRSSLRSDSIARIRRLWLRVLTLSCIRWIGSIPCSSSQVIEMIFLSRLWLIDQSSGN